MTASIVPLTFHGAEVRVVDIDGVPFFVGKDVCDVLGYTNANKAMADHCRGVTNRYPIADALGRSQDTRVLPEGDVLRLVVRSKLPDAIRFERWVFDEVLPTIRRTGSYGRPALDLNDPRQLRDALQSYAERVIALEARAAEQQPHVAALARISASDGMFNLTSAAKLVDMPPRKFVDRLHSTGWIYRRTPGGPWYAHQDKVRAGLLAEKVTFITRDDDGNEKVRAQVLVTAKGITAIAKAIERGLNTAAREIEACAAVLGAHA